MFVVPCYLLLVALEESSTRHRLPAHVVIGQVPHRSDAWRSLWRELFDVVDAEFAAHDAADDARCLAAPEEKP